MPQFNKKPLIMLVSACMLQTAYAQNNDEENTAVTLGTLQVTIQRAASTSVSERTDTESIQTALVRDSYDLVRYSPDIGIADDGRRTKGFALRGVEGNRVGISIDGVALPDSEENSLYARYGNFNDSRLALDTEMVRMIEVKKGASAFGFGSGALGGAVEYRTLNASDLLDGEKEWGALVRTGYASKNREWVKTLGVGFDNGVVDALALYSRRDGHELTSAGGDKPLVKSYPTEDDKDTKRHAEFGAAAMNPDPATHQYDSYLLKLGYQLTPQQKLGIAVNKQRNDNFVNEKSYSLLGTWRDANDVQYRRNTNLYYEFTPTNHWLSRMRADVDLQKTTNSSVNYKGDYERLGDWRTGYDYVRGETTSIDNRALHSNLKRLTLTAAANPWLLGNTQHKVSGKVLFGQRDFENINHDKQLAKDGSVSFTDVYSIQHPVRSTQYGLALQDELVFASGLLATFGLRYDKEQVSTNPSDVACGKASGSFGRLCATATDDANFSNTSGVLALEKPLNQHWRANYTLATGFRNPTASEMYFTFESPYGNWLANSNLQAEKSLSHNLGITGQGKYGNLLLNVYHTRYKDFLFEQETSLKRTDPSCDPWYAQAGYCKAERNDYFQQMVNLDRATIAGVEVSSQLLLGALNPRATGFSVYTGLGYSRGKLSNADSLLSVQPLKAVLGLDYEHTDQRFGVFSRATYMGGKKPKDAQYSELVDVCVAYSFDYWRGQETCSETTSKLHTQAYEYLNKSAVTFDVFGYYRLKDNLTLRAGVYNLFNEKYHTWDALRGINKRATINTVPNPKHNPALTAQGLERYYAPGRNYALAIEYRF